MKPTEKSPNSVMAWLSTLGPGLITAALVFGPSKMTITSKLGSEYGFSLVWIIIVAITFMAVFTIMAGRIGNATNISLLSLIRNKWGKSASVIVGLGIFFVATSFQAGNAIGVGISIAEANNTTPELWVILFTLLGITLLFFRSFYKVMEKVMIILIGTMLFAFITTFFLIQPSLGSIFSGLKPTIPSGSLPLVIAFTASCFSIVGAFYQSYLVQERKRSQTAYTQQKNGSLTGIILLGFMSFIVMICAASVLHPENIKVNNATDMAKALEPLFGNYASALFLTGLFGASFSSLIGNASVGGTLLGDALGYNKGLNSKMVRLLIALVMIIGASIALLFGKIPLELIVFAQSVTIFVVPVIGIAMYTIANDREIMGVHKNSVAIKIAGALGLLLIILLALQNARELFF
jgi:manganese transport protein